MQIIIRIGMKEIEDPFIKIAVSIGSLMMGVTVLTMMFGKEEAWLLIPITSFMTILGIMMGYFSIKQRMR